MQESAAAKHATAGRRRCPTPAARAGSRSTPAAKQFHLFAEDTAAVGTFRDPAFMANRTMPIHRWVPWIAGFSKQFIEDAIERYTNGRRQTVLDPFAGVGTTLVEADLAGHDAIGFEINPYAAFAAQTKLMAHRVRSDTIRQVIRALDEHSRIVESNGTHPSAAPPPNFHTRSPFYSPEVERKVLLMQDFVRCQSDADVSRLCRLAFASTMVDYSNYSYEPSLGRRSAVGRSEVEDYPVASCVAAKLAQMADDVDWYRRHRVLGRRPDGRVQLQSFFDGYKRLDQGSVDLLVTSPPYANNYHYNRNTRPHLYWLGFCESPADLKKLESLNFGTYWQQARDRDRIELDPFIDDCEIRRTISDIRERNPDRGIYGGFGWANYVTIYLNDCVRFLAGVKWCLRSGSTALIVIGNSIVQGVPVPTDRFLATIARRHGLTVVEIHTPRATRVGNSIINSSVRSGAGKAASLYESVVEIRQP